MGDYIKWKKKMRLISVYLLTVIMIIRFVFIHFQTEEINRLTGVYKRLLSNAGVKLFEGEGRVIGPNDVEIIQLDGTKISYSAKHILIATGSRAQRPAIPGQVCSI